MPVDIPLDLRRLAVRRAGGRCEYCQFPERYAAHRHEPDHVIALQHGGLTAADNLALACLRCNRYKGPNIASIDTESGQLVALFNPRSQRWESHFTWDGERIVARTPEARVTIRLLRMNESQRLDERRALIRAGVDLSAHG